MGHTELRNITSGDVIVVQDESVGYYKSTGQWVPSEETEAVDVEEPAAVELKGEALDDALRDSGLPLTGTADEKRARLADFLAEEQ